MNIRTHCVEYFFRVAFFIFYKLITMDKIKDTSVTKIRIFFLFLSLVTLPYMFSFNPSGSFLERTLVFDMGDNGSRFYRIPGIVTAADGSLVVVADKRWDKINDLPAHIDVVSRRSEDNGKTWSEAVTIAGKETTVGYGDPAIVLDKRTGHLLCIFASGNGLWQSNENK